MEKIGIFYGSNGGNTMVAAQIMAKKIGPHAEAIVITRKTKEEIEQYQNLIFGTSTWGAGELQEDWSDFLPTLRSCNLEGKTIALFGLGDGFAYGDTFADGLSHLHSELEGRCTIVGSTDASGYTFDSSLSVRDGVFVGLVLDEANESDLSEARIDTWLSEILPKFS